MSLSTTYIRAAYSPFVTALGIVFATAFVIGPLAFGGWMLSLEISAATIGLAVLALGASIFFAVMLHNNFQWIELDGETLRGRRLFSRILVEQRVSDLTRIITFYRCKAPLQHHYECRLR